MIPSFFDLSSFTILVFVPACWFVHAKALIFAMGQQGVGVLSLSVVLAKTLYIYISPSVFSLRFTTLVPRF